MVVGKDLQFFQDLMVKMARMDTEEVEEERTRVRISFQTFAPMNATFSSYLVTHLDIHTFTHKTQSMTLLVTEAMALL